MRRRWAWPHRFEPPPLVDDDTVRYIHRLANSPLAPQLLAQREVRHILLGERQSAFAGRGYEFAENLPYYPGDEARFINWRLLARSGELYRKVFYEERRPPVWLVLDRGTSMRFGTRIRIKAAYAAQLALFHAFLAQKSGLLINAIIRDASLRWLVPSQDPAGQHALIQQICSPCPPLPERDDSGELPALLEQCLVRMSPGCIVIVYSDFHNLQASDMQLFHALARKHTVYARHIIDISEQALPRQGDYRFAQGTEVITLDCSDAALVERYQRQMQQQRDEISGWFQQAEISYQINRADEDLFQGLEQRGAI